MKSILKQILPIFDSLEGYSASWFRKDLVAGLTVAIMLIPQGMAYAYLAGMPPIYGLYGGLIPLFLYALLGTSRQLSIGPVAISALLVMAGVSQLAQPSSPRYIELVITAGILIGIVQVLLGLFRMGFLVNFLSHPVVAGFTSAAAVIIAINQLKDVLRLDIPRFEHTYETLYYTLENVGQSHWISLLIGLSAIILMVLLRRISRSIPDSLIVVALSIFLSWLLKLDQSGVEIIKSVPEGLPGFLLPDLEVNTIRALLPTVFTVTIIGVVESIGIAKVLESKHQDYEVRANQELLALGISKIGGSFFQALPTSGSFSRSAINDDAGAKTGVASLVTALAVGLTLLFLTPLFYYLPKAVLAAIILMAVKNLFDYKEAVHLWHTHRQDFVMMMVTFCCTLLLGIEEGVLVGVLLSVLTVLYRSSKPHVAILGKLPGKTYYRNINRFEEAEQIDKGIIMRFDNQLYFGNSTYFKEVIKQLVQESQTELDYFFLDAKSMFDIDSSGLRALDEIFNFLKQKNIQLYICGAIGPVRDMLDKSGLTDKIGSDYCFHYINEAIEAHEYQKNRS